MNNFWAFVRRCGTSLMLLAALALVLHSGLVAASDFAFSDCAGHAGHAATVTATHTHAHADGSSHTHATAAAPASQIAVQAEHADGTQPCKAPCCGASCTLAVLTAPSLTVAVASHAVTMMIPLEDVPGGIDPNGLKRPPRPLLIV